MIIKGFIMNTNEPSLNQIDDYNGHESKSKRKTVNFIIAALLIIGVILGVLKSNNSKVSDYVGTPQHPGINVQKGY